MSKIVNFLSKFKGYFFVGVLPLVLVAALKGVAMHLGTHGVPKPIHGVSYWITQHVIAFFMLHSVVLLGFYVYLSKRINRILTGKKLSEPERKQLLDVKLWFIGLVVFLECLFIIQVNL